MVANRSSSNPKVEIDGDATGYQVVARRYRPQRFAEVIGQDHVVQALSNAIRMKRVTHAYLFSGTRGVGKTSIARIFAKCLNCVHGPTSEPCLQCDICEAIAVGQDVDVIEIDGASNNGVEAVRELRQNAGLRPSRSRYKIYYIDEVHMLSTGAFNALLKTLEEPPEHVKFFFATTEPNKIPITVLSRCQRYDFAGISPDAIVATLESICQREGIEAESEALRTVARRATGSMRDAQSLLEQLLSSGAPKLTVEVVHSLLGMASDERLLDLLDALADRDPARALQFLDAAGGASVQPIDVLNGLLEYLRDVMVLATGANGTLLTASPLQRPRLQAVAGRWPLDSVLAGLQILAESRGRMRGSPHGRLLVEMALVRIARLENLGELGDLIARLGALEAGTPLAPVEAKKRMTAPEAGPSAIAASPPVAPPTEIQTPPLESVNKLWPELLKAVGVRIAVPLGRVDPSAVAISAPNLLVISLSKGYNWIADECEVPEIRARILKELQSLLNRPVMVRFDRSLDEGQVTDTALRPGTPPKSVSPVMRTAGAESDPMVQKVVQLFDARPVHMDVEDQPEVN